MKIIFGSDVSVHAGSENEKLFAERKTKEIFGDVLDVLKNADATVVNLECAVTESENRIKKCGGNIKMPYGTCETLVDAGIKYVGISNNHVYDFGREGLLDTIRELEKNGIQYTGVGDNVEDARKDMIIETKDGKKIAIIAVCEHEYSYALDDREGCREYDPYDTNDDIVNAKITADYVVVMYHGAKEHSRYPSPRIIKACRSMVKHGADLVMCQHTHCIGCYEEFMGGHILYGQGNFVFVEPHNKSDLWNTMLLVEANFGDKLTVDFIPVVTNKDATGVELAKGEEKERLLSELKERSEKLKDGTWMEEWDKFCWSMGWYRFIPEEIKERTAHYIDCEAHLDVMKHIYKTAHYTNERDNRK